MLETDQPSFTTYEITLGEHRNNADARIRMARLAMWGFSPETDRYVQMEDAIRKLTLAHDSYSVRLLRPKEQKALFDPRDAIFTPFKITDGPIVQLTEVIYKN